MDGKEIDAHSHEQTQRQPAFLAYLGCLPHEYTEGAPWYGIYEDIYEYPALFTALPFGAVYAVNPS